MTHELLISISGLFLSVVGIIFTAGVMVQRVKVCERDILENKALLHELRREHLDGIKELREHLDVKLTGIYDRLDRISRDTCTRNNGEPG